MAFNKMTKMAIKALSYRDINVKKNYKVVRRMINITHPAYRKKFYQCWNHQFRSGEYDVPVRIFMIEKKVSPVMIFFHGGGWVTGNIDSYDRVCANLASITGNTIVSVDYRLAPEHKFPTAPEDCYAVTKAIYQQSQELFGIPTEQITLIGDSAGANLAAVVSLMARDRKEFEVKKQVLIYPAVNNDFTEKSIYPSIRENGTDYILTSKRMCDYMDLYQGKPEDRYNPYFAPILAESLANQPETLIVTAQYDPLRDEGEAYGEKLRQFGNQVEIHRIPDVLHGFFALPIRYQSTADCYELVRLFLQKEEKQTE